MKQIGFILLMCLFVGKMKAQEETDITYIDSLFGQLPEVMVKGERPVVKAERGKLVYDMPRLMEQLPVSNAYEAIKELPGIMEDGEGNLSLGGRGVAVVINGKVSTLGWEQLKTMLESTPVSRLEKAEVMYAAPARYGIRGAMINVVLKRAVGQPASLSGEVQGRYIQNRKEAAKMQGTLLYASQRISVDAMYAYTHSRSTSTQEKVSWHTVGGTLHEMTLDTDIAGRGGRHDYRLGMDMDLGKKHQLGIVYNGNYREGEDRTRMRGTAESEQTSEGTRMLHNVKADYQAPFGLSAGADFTYFDSPTDEWRTTLWQGTEERFRSESNQRINRWLLYANQTHEWKGGEWNYGIRYTTTHDHTYQAYFDRDTGEPIPERTAKSLREEYSLNLHTGTSFGFGTKWSGELSLAAELYHARERHSWMLYPTLNLTYQPADGHVLQFSFTSERVYPDYWHLQSLVQYVDSYTEVHGNPTLKPSSYYTFGVNYLQKNKYMIGVWYQRKPDYFTQLPYQPSDRLAEINQFVNYDYQESWIGQGMAFYRVGKKWRGRVVVTAVLNHDKLDDFHGLSFNRRKFVARLATQNTFILSRRPNLIATLSGNYQTSAMQGIYDIRPMGSLDVSLQWTSANQKAKLILKGEDLLQTKHPRTRIDWQGQRMDRTMDWDTRQVSLTLVYHLGNYKEKKRQEVDTSRMGR